MKRWLIGGAAVVAAALALGVGIPVGVGSMLPAEHAAGVSVTLPADASDVWATLADVSAYPEWRTGVSAVTWQTDGMAPDPLHDVWVESSSFGDIPFRRLTSEPPRRLVTEIASDDLGFGGTWTFELRPGEGASTEVRILEQGRVDNPLFRFMTRYVFGYYGTLDQFAVDLGDKYGVTVTPEHWSSP